MTMDSRAIRSSLFIWEFLKTADEQVTQHKTFVDLVVMSQKQIRAKLSAACKNHSSL